jgi:hypothetical protein
VETGTSATEASAKSPTNTDMQRDSVAADSDKTDSDKILDLDEWRKKHQRLH